MTTELINVPFHDETILTIEKENGRFLPIKPICSRLGLSDKGQIQRLKRQKKLWNGCVMHPVGASKDGKTREMFCIPINRTAMWLASITISRVKSEYREALELFQIEAADALDAYFTGKTHGDITRLQSQLGAAHVHLLAQFPRWGKLVGLLNGGAREYLVYKRSNMTSEQFDLEVREMDRCGLLDPVKFNVGLGETVLQERDRLRTELWVAKIKTEQLEAATDGRS